MESNQGNSPQEKPVQKPAESFKLLPVALEVGGTIAIPLVFLALVGRYADKTFGTSPFLLLTGMLLAITISTVFIYKKVSKLF